MNPDFIAFGEMLWDCLPSGRHAGGAPFNVAAHLAQLGAPVALISAVGADPFGDEVLQVARDKEVGTQFITRAQIGLSTGTVVVAVDADGNATYEIVQPAAWDEICVGEDAFRAVADARAFMFGSLAARSPHNHKLLERLLALEGPLKFFDVNLRPPFVDPALVLHLAKRADILKLNSDEAGRLASWLQTGSMTLNTPLDSGELNETCVRLAAATGVTRICVTRGAEGVAFWDRGDLVCVPAPQVAVRDTVGAGDAFAAGLMVGLKKKLEIRSVLESACRLGAYVASREGPTPLLPRELIGAFKG